MAKTKKDKQRSTKHSCSTSGTRRTLNTNPVISHEWGNDREMLTTDLTYPWLFVIPIFRKISKQ